MGDENPFELNTNKGWQGAGMSFPGLTTNQNTNFTAPNNTNNGQTDAVAALLAALGKGQQSLSPFKLADDATPSIWNMITGYSQNGQNYSGIGGSIWNAAAGGIQAYLSYQAYKAQRDLARDQFNLQKAQFEDNKKRYWEKWDRQNAARNDAMM